MMRNGSQARFKGSPHLKNPPQIEAKSMKNRVRAHPGQHLAAKRGPRAPKMHPRRARRPQDGPSCHPNSFNPSPRRPQDGRPNKLPRRLAHSQDAPKTAQNSFKKPSNAQAIPKTPARRPKRLSESSILVLRDLGILGFTPTRRPNKLPRRPETHPRCNIIKLHAL